eukprot:Gb_41331 [translate_table: standard]
MAIFLYIFVALSLSAHPIEAVHGQWCVADPQAPASLLQGALDWACGAGGADCSAIQWNQPCFMPNTLASHASYAFNIYWQKAKHRGASCHFNAAAFVTETNPSHDGCQFVFVA